MEKPAAFVMEMGGMVVEVAAISHIGSTTLVQNQDAHLELPLSDDCLLVGVFDGHSPDLGQIAARAAKAYFASVFRDPALLDEVLEAPEPTLRRLFRECHQHVFTRFKAFYTNQSCTVREERGGYLTYRMPGHSQPVRCVYGGTTATLVLLHHRRLIVANVGDSLALLAQTTISPRDLQWHAACRSAPAPASPVDDPTANNQSDNQADEWTPYVLLAGLHAPDCTTEFKRLEHVGLGLQCMFDHSTDPHDRVPIFKRDHVVHSHAFNPAHINETGQVRKGPPPRGGYVKNARNEWASVVTTPPHAAFPDTLAFTRSLGDFHMHAYGVTCEPDIVEATVEPGATLLVATDGVWDVWQFTQVVSFLQTCGDSATERIQRFMHENASRANDLFGQQADNMTAVLCTFRQNH
ncbi:hypothetical protein DYB32_005011 [Aphanomyces invadans]|uniref:PPM-type phosphatase domain-containing protein n=1 Tax=Aphanomyces invadans TaxID=157072 RepID=A0A418AVU2_9STRA|nr:hypothetical protein DYB32_005011 [Aphanomyces invadans]